MELRPLRVAAPEHYGLRPDSTVGGEVYERELLRRLPDHGIALTIGLPGPADFPVPDGWEVRPVRRRHWALAPIAYVPWLHRVAAPDLLRAGSVRLTGPSVLLARRRGVPVVLHQHHLEPRWRRLEVALLRRADAVITVSEHSRAALVAAGVRAERVHVVPNGVEVPPPGPSAEDAWPPGAGLRLLHVGRLEARKRPEVAVRALAGTPAASLVIAGEGPTSGDLRRLAADLGLGDRVRMEGRVTEDRKWALYAAADVLLFPSALEGFGLVAAEAHACGLPVVAATGTGTAEVVAHGRSGLLVAPTPEAFAGAIARLADAEERAAMAREARSIGARLSWDACAAAVAEVYRAVVRSSGPAGAGPEPARGRR